MSELEPESGPDPGQGTATLTGNAIYRFRLLTLKAALGLEIKGMKRRGKSVYQILKDEFNFKGSRESVLEQLEAHIETLKPKEENNGTTTES